MVLSSVAIIPRVALVGDPPIRGAPPHLKVFPKAALPFEVSEDPWALLLPLWFT